MTITIDNGVTITLTEDQLKEIERQRNPFKSSSDINSYEDACKILNTTPKKDPSSRVKVKTIIKAANFLDNNGDVWRENWDNHSQYKYYPIFERKAGGWVVYCSYYCNYAAVGGFGSYFKEEKTCLLIAKKFLPLYIDYIENEEIG